MNIFFCIIRVHFARERRFPIGGINANIQTIKNPAPTLISGRGGLWCKCGARPHWDNALQAFNDMNTNEYLEIYTPQICPQLLEHTPFK